MAERRMFSRSIVDGDTFLDMPLSAQALYFHLSLRADDDGFINNAKRVCALIGASIDDYKLLIVKQFLIVFDSGVVVIRHWRIHNYIQRDRYKETIYQEEKSQLSLNKNNAYVDTNCIQPVSKADTNCIQPVSKADTNCIQPVSKADTNCIQPVSKVDTNCIQPVSKADTNCIQPVSKVDTNCIQPVSKVDTQVSIGKYRDSIEYRDSIDTVSKKVSNKKNIQSYDEIFEDFSVAPVVKEALLEFIRHLQVNGVVMINSRLENIIVLLDRYYVRDELAKAEYVRSAINAGFKKLPFEE